MCFLRNTVKLDDGRFHVVKIPRYYKELNNLIRVEFLQNTGQANNAGNLKTFFRKGELKVPPKICRRASSIVTSSQYNKRFNFIRAINAFS